MRIHFVSTLTHIALYPLNRRHKFAALLRFVRWQVGMRLIRSKAIVQWVDEARLVVGRGETGLTGNVYCGLMEYEEMLFLLHFLRPDHLFVDVGANAGAYTVLASKVVG